MDQPTRRSVPTSVLFTLAGGAALTAILLRPVGGAAGPRQATIDFGAPKHLERVMIWNHGVEHTPAEAKLEVWTGEAWKTLQTARHRNVAHVDGSGYADADEFTFDPIEGSKLRYSFDNSGKNVNGTWNIHGWLYEIEVFGRDST